MCASELESTFCLHCLSHIQVPLSTFRQRWQTLGEQASYKLIWIGCEGHNIREYVLRENGGIRWSDCLDGDELSLWARAGQLEKVEIAEMQTYGLRQGTQGRRSYQSSIVLE